MQDTVIHVMESFLHTTYRLHNLLNTPLSFFPPDQAPMLCHNWVRRRVRHCPCLFAVSQPSSETILTMAWSHYIMLGWLLLMKKRGPDWHIAPYVYAKLYTIPHSSYTASCIGIKGWVCAEKLLIGDSITVLDPYTYSTA